VVETNNLLKAAIMALQIITSKQICWNIVVSAKSWRHLKKIHVDLGGPMPCAFYEPKS
jgi:hypothetical protein